MRTLIALAAMLALAACDAADLETAKQEAASLGGQALEAATSAVDTRTACVMAGQSEAFCGCVQERLGPRITREHVEDLANVTLQATSAEGVEAAAREAENIDPATREAVVQCATHAAVQGMIGQTEAE